MTKIIGRTRIVRNSLGQYRVESEEFIPRSMESGKYWKPLSDALPSLEEAQKCLQRWKSIEQELILANTWVEVGTGENE